MLKWIPQQKINTTFFISVLSHSISFSYNIIIISNFQDSQTHFPWLRARIKCICRMNLKIWTKCVNHLCVINECNIISQWEQIKMEKKENEKKRKNIERTTATKDNMCACKGESCILFHCCFLYSIFLIFVWCILILYLMTIFWLLLLCNASTYEYWENRNIVSYMLLPGTGQKIDKKKQDLL